jgi:hypothetical protein
LNLTERDAVVLSLFTAITVTGRQEVLETIRQGGANHLALPGLSDDAALTRATLETDIDGLRTAVADLATGGDLRAKATALLATTSGAASSGQRIVPYPKPASVASTDHFRMRVIAAGG